MPLIVDLGAALATKGAVRAGAHSVRMVCPVHGSGTRDSLKVSHGEKGPVWHCHAGCDSAAIKGVLLDMGILRDDPDAKADPAPDSKEDEKRRMDAARKIWSDGTRQDEMVEAYFAHRGIHPKVTESAVKSGVIKWSIDKMIAAVTVDGRRLSATHRTTIKGAKATSRKVFGFPNGGAVRLFVAKPPESLAIAEGIETAVAFSQLYGIPTWAVLSANGIEKFVVPPEVKNLAVAADFDGTGIKAYEGLARRLSHENWQGKLVLMLPGRPPFYKKDWNDVLRESEPEK